MNKIITSISLATATVILCLCGIFYNNFIVGSVGSHGAVPAAARRLEMVAEEPVFDIKSAREYLELCSLSYSPGELEKRLLSLGCERVEHFSRDQEGSFGSGTAFSVGIKKRESGGILLLMIFRGTNKGEWYSNFSVGNSFEHAGFSAACDYAIERLDELIRGLHTEDGSISIFATGHSRGGAVANLAAKRLIDRGVYRSVNACTFAAPGTTTDPSAQERYGSIVNIVNPEDFIPYLPLDVWGYQKYGITVELPKTDSENYDDLYKKMQTRYSELTQKPHTGYKNGDRDVREFIRLLSRLAPTVDDYYNKVIYVPPYELTLYEYMQKVSDILSNDKALLDGMFLISSGCVRELSQMTDFLMQGIDIEKTAEDHDMTSSAIYCGHTYETYMAWLDVLDEEYFLSKLAK